MVTHNNTRPVKFIPNSKTRHFKKNGLYFDPALCLSDFHSHKRVNNQTKKTNNFDKQCQNLIKLARSISEADMECKFSGFPNPESKDFWERNPKIRKISKFRNSTGTNQLKTAKNPYSLELLNPLFLVSYSFVI